MRSAAVALVLLVGGCGASGLAIANGTALGVSSAALACDWAQTRSYADAGWMRRRDALTVQPYRERNPILGGTPSPGEVDLYFVGLAGLNALAWYFMPRRWRWAIPTVVTAVQIYAVAGNTARMEAEIGACDLYRAESDG